MLFKGYSKIFSTKNEQQYNTIGRFWDEMSDLYGKENLRGLGYNWENDTIEYVIGAKHNSNIDINVGCQGAVYKEITLPDENWILYKGKTEHLSELYDEIYQSGTLDYEIETFFEDGTCEININRCCQI
ncbi:MAG: hypothetical protein K2K56_04580 [Lachnospiraceae bacterium]|nr:hypothetical protein [Lachnospiraceae bacterium]MDE6625629.1 hypothetical protein [Lachnospiraceae bacterium]